MVWPITQVTKRQVLSMAISSRTASDNGRRARLGFRDGRHGAHTSRTMMLSDVRLLFDALVCEASPEDYRRAIVDENLLAKPTGFARQAACRHLTDLYGLNPRLPIFRVFRQLWPIEPEGQPLLALLCALARDPLLRESVPYLQGLTPGQTVTNDALQRWLEERFPGRFRPTTLKSVAQNLNGTWTQAGFFTGKIRKTRTHPTVTPSATAFALFLGYLEGGRALNLFSTFWAGLLERNVELLTEQAAIAGQRGLLDYRSAGSILEVRFHTVLTPSEQELLRE